MADSALYTTKMIAEISPLTQWITRVPVSIAEAKFLIKKFTKEEMSPNGDGYFVSEICNSYGGVKQRWLVVFSEKAFDRESKNLEKQITREEDKQKKELRQLSLREYSCEADATQELTKFAKRLKYHTCTQVKIQSKVRREKPGRPKKEDFGQTVYQLSCTLERDIDKIDEILKTKGKFIIATNELDSNRLSHQDLLANYKKQQSVERGFRFLKDPMFMTSSLFLKNEKRIVALGLIMCLCLLVYTLAQRKLRLKLKELKETLPDQKGKPTDRPTMRWIYQIFEDVHPLYRVTDQGVSEIVLNLNALRIKVLVLMGPIYQQLYEDAA